MFILLVGNIFKVIEYNAKVIFLISLIGTTMQDGSTRERRDGCYTNS